MANGTWAATDASSEVLAADVFRTSVELQFTSGSIMYIAFGEDAVYGEGLRLHFNSPYYKVDDKKAALGVSVICDTGGVAAGGYETVVVSASATLDLSYTDLQEEIGHYLGYDITDISSWSAGETAEVDRCIQSGLRQFYYPPAVADIESGYDWSFLKPTTTLTTTASDAVQDLPSDFGRLLGDFHFASTVYAPSIVMVSEHRLQTLLSQDTNENRPRFVAIRSQGSVGLAVQVQEVAFWPIPSDAWTLTYRYEVYAGKLVKLTNPYPHGGMKHGETITESCLAMAEQRSNDEKGLHWNSFVAALAASIKQDRKNSAKYFGAMSTGEANYRDPREYCLKNGEITYNGSTW